MALTAQQIIDRAKQTLNDPDAVQWPESELLGYLSDAQRAAVQIRPEVNPFTVEQALLEGSRQTIPSDGFVLLEVVRNMGGRAISMVDKYFLDRWQKNWHTADSNAQVKNYTYDSRNRKVFYVLPPQPSVGGTVEIVYSKIPNELSAIGDEIELDDIYQPALLAYVLYRAFVKDLAAEGQSLERSNAYYTLFLAALGERDQADRRIHPTLPGEMRRRDRGT